MIRRLIPAIFGLVVCLMVTPSYSQISLDPEVEKIIRDLDRMWKEAMDEMPTGNDLYETCKDEYELCVPFVRGVIDTRVFVYIKVLTMMSLRKENVSQEIYDGVQAIIWPYCSSANSTVGQYTDIFVNYLKNNPEARDKPAALLVRDALAEALPCPDGSAGQYLDLETE